MAGRKPIEGEMSESDIEFFRRELKSREPSQLTLITGTGDEAQKVLRDMIDAGASIQDGKLSDKHEAAVDGNKMKIEQTLQIEESIAQSSAMPGMTLRAKRGEMKRQTDKKKSIDLRIGDDMEEIDYVKKLKIAIDASDLKNHIDETFQETDFSVKEFHTENYPKNSQAYLIEAEFYCRKAREYRAKELAAATEAEYYGDLEKMYATGKEGKDLKEQSKIISRKYRKVVKGYSEVFYYCIQEAVYWKLKAEIYNNSEQDKKRIQDPTKSSSCNIHSENDVTKYVYIPTDKKNIDEAKIDLELSKVGLGARNGVDNVMLVVKEFEECKEQNTLDMISMLSHYGGEFKDRGMVMVTEESKLIDDDQAEDFPETESKYFSNEAKSEDYSDIIKILTAEKRIFSFDKKSIDGSKMRTEMGEFFNQEREDHRSIDNFRKIQNSSKIVHRATEGVRHTSKLTQTGMNVYRYMYTSTKGVDIQVDKRMIDQVWEARGYVNKLRIEEMQYVEGRRRIETGRRHDIHMQRQRVEQAEANRRLEEERRHNLEIQMERQRVEQAESNRKLEEKQRNLEIEMEKQRMEKAEAKRRLEEEQRRNLEIQMERQRVEQAEANRKLDEERRNLEIQMEKRRKEQAEANKRLEEERRNLEIEKEKRRLEQAERERRREEEREREREREKMEREKKLKQEIESRNEEFKQIRRNGEDQLRKVKEWLDECEKKDHQKYLEVKSRYEELAEALKRTIPDDGDLERKLRNLNELIIEGETWNLKVRDLHRDQIDAAELIVALIAAAVLAGGAAGIVGGAATAGAGVGAVVGLVGGPVGAAVGGVVGGVVGGAVGVVGAALSYFKFW